MTTVYLVSSGEYSSYGVGPVFSTEALAQEYIDKWKKFGNHEYGIEERELDPEHEMNIPLQNGWTHFKVIMFKDGTSDIEENMTYSNYQDNDTAAVSLGWNWIKNKYVKTVTLFAPVWAVNEQGAAKIVNEKRTRLIASGEWEKMEKHFEKELRKDHQ